MKNIIGINGYLFVMNSNLTVEIYVFFKHTSKKQRVQLWCGGWGSNPLIISPEGSIEFAPYAERTLLGTRVTNILRNIQCS